MGGERLDHQPPYRRRVNTVFQHYALFPHLTVEQNVAYGLRVAKRPAAEIAQRVAEALDKVKMTAHAKTEAVEDQRRAAAARGAGAGAGEPPATCCCSMNRFRRWMRICAGRCRWN